ncbi:MAG: 4-hydroxy-2-oxoheptanedioate aldolase [Sphaerochaeta sp.]|jgi:2-keto-3-deoxy-L-rhamnonate aldolase RhmA|nr:4-hydroxy-2-oxoheptanedioate aldolase [Sphaerochaeta sp.]
MAVKELRNGEAVVGTMIRMVRNPGIVLLAANAGLDFIMFDMEHGAFNFETIADAASMARTRGIDCFIRVPELSKGNVSRCLDCGVTGIMVPMIRNGKEAQKLANWAKFAPIGERGLGGNGAHTGYLDASKDPLAFMEEENKKVLAIAQIELKEAIENIDEIAAVEGIDALLIGPADLSNSYGISGQFNHPIMDEAIQKVADAAKKHGKVFGFHAGESLTRKWIPSGLKLRMSNMDINLLANAMKEINSLRD